MTMGLFFMFIAALMAALSSLCMRKGIDVDGSSRRYLIVQFSCSWLLAIILNPVRTGNYAFHMPSVLLGGLGGLSLGLMMYSIGRALENGPAGLTLAIVNAATVVPAWIMVLCFGSSYGHSYTVSNGLGAFLMLAGFFWAGHAMTPLSERARTLWVRFVVLAFVGNVFFLAFLAWWALVLKSELSLHRLLPLHIDEALTPWFMPSVLLVAALFQWVVYFVHKESKPSRRELTMGLLGGGANSLCAYFMILAPQMTMEWENPLLFPLFAVSLIIACNVWSQLLYKEKVNWKANAVALLGIIVSSAFH